jgi:hypothetical protein
MLAAPESFKNSLRSIGYFQSMTATSFYTGYYMPDNRIAIGTLPVN